MFNGKVSFRRWGHCCRNIFFMTKGCSIYCISSWGGFRTSYGSSGFIPSLHRTLRGAGDIFSSMLCVRTAQVIRVTSADWQRGQARTCNFLEWYIYAWGIYNNIFHAVAFKRESSRYEYCRVAIFRLISADVWLLFLNCRCPQTCCFSSCWLIGFYEFMYCTPFLQNFSVCQLGAKGAK